MAAFTVNTHHAYLNSDIIIKSNGPISIEDVSTGKIYKFNDELCTHLTAGHHILKTGDYEEELIIEDAIKLGGSRIKKAFVFDNNPWIFVATKDRLYIANRETQEERVEFNITPDFITPLAPSYWGHFLFQTKDDYAIYNVYKGKIIFCFANHIYSNGHIVIFDTGEGISVYNYYSNGSGKELVRFNGQYSFGHKFYFVKDNRLFGLNLSSLYINEINYLGQVTEYDVLLDNSLLKFESNYTDKITYSYYSLGNGENSMCKKTTLVLPYFIESWKGKKTKLYQKVLDWYQKYKEEARQASLDTPNVKSMVFGFRITQEKYLWNEGMKTISFSGEIITYPALKFKIPFILKGIEGGVIDYNNMTIEKEPSLNDDNNNDDTAESFPKLNNGEKLLGKSALGKLLITQEGAKLFLRNLVEDTRNEILRDNFDSSKYNNAYFTSDGKSVVLQLSDTEGKLIGIDDFETLNFDVEGFTVARNEGFNGYKPEVFFAPGKKPVWRDPITLNWIDEKHMSSHIFMSPNGEYTADVQMKTVLYNRLTGSEVDYEAVAELRNKYNWTPETGKEERKAIIGLRKQLAEESDRYALFGKIIDSKNQAFSSVEDENDRNQKRERVIENNIKSYINEAADFVSLFIDKLSYVCYRKKGKEKDEKRILIGRSVYYLNYVSFSYDSKYLSFAAKMKTDDFRISQEGVFEIFDLEKEEIVNRTENIQNHQLWAVWMTMFSKKGDVAFYDSCSNAYLITKNSGYVDVIEASGKSLLCFSPSGKYIACSDQNYIDYTHHPNTNWGHQPSGNVYIHAVDEFEHCLEQYNDLGEDIEGVANKAGNVSSAAFSQDEKRLMVVGTDGVVVIRNLHLIEADSTVNFFDGIVSIGSRERRDFRCEERSGLVRISYFGFDGITEDLVEYWCGIDETLDSKQGLVYSADGKRLIKSLSIYKDEYTIKDGVTRIEDGVFQGIYGPGEGEDNHLRLLHIPNSIEYIGEEAFDEHGKNVTIYISSDKVNEFQEKFSGFNCVFAPEPNKRNTSFNNQSKTPTIYCEYACSYAQDVMGYSDDVINDAFYDDPDAYWNID